MNPSSTPALQARQLVKRFGGILATQQVDLMLPQGARHALIGPNGAGKTTLIQLMTGMLPADGGQVLLAGEDITHLPPHQRVKRGLVRTFQINQLFDSLTPWQTLILVASEHLGLGKRWWQPLGQDARAVPTAQRLVEQFHLEDVCHRRTRELAYGKRRLLEMAIALACEPRVLLLDEPVAGVPAGEREELLATIARLPDSVAILLIEHDMDLVFSFADRISVLVNGALLTEGGVDEIARDPQVRAVYLGESGHE
jgi:branched-chain amino acid transport system ATP-binding protein